MRKRTEEINKIRVLLGKPEIKEIAIKANIESISRSKYNYKGKDEMLGLPKLFPQEKDLDMSVIGVKQNRIRYQSFPDRLPTNNGEMPYPPDNHPMIGQYEFPHNTYLLLAHAFNKAMERIDALEKKLSELKVDSK